MKLYRHKSLQIIQMSDFKLDGLLTNTACFLCLFSSKIQDLSSQARDGTFPTAMEAQSVNHWTTGEVPT